MSSTNAASSIDYKTLFEQEKQLKEEALEKLERVNTTAILIINKLQRENVSLKDEKSILVEEKKNLFEKNMELIEENESLIIRNQILVMEKNHLERIYQEMSDFLMFLLDFFDDDYDNYLLDREKCNNFIYHKDNFYYIPNINNDDDYRILCCYM
ncbi:8926_t:CDS:2 [Scutellospora calospora]|uniref:8926_t:CDS:1 n=1 Tax=Scutellospora calospora TaxID=85575 RepID=A0ACA9KAG8_9GLOM|nr:8926_t:CDS:2 [Scutellospora calospora]